VWCTHRRGSRFKVAALLTEAGHRSACAWCTQRVDADARRLLLSVTQGHTGACVGGAHRSKRRMQSGCSSHKSRPQACIYVVHTAWGKCNAAPLAEAGHRSACAWWCTQHEEAKAKWLLLSQRQTTGACVRGARSARKQHPGGCSSHRSRPQERACVVHSTRGKQKRSGCSSVSQTEAGHRSACAWSHPAQGSKSNMAAPLTETGA
jgi:hypothetical protein